MWCSRVLCVRVAVGGGGRRPGKLSTKPGNGPLCCCPVRASHPDHGVPAHLTFIFREWICMILARASSLGIGNSIFRSRRPERSRAGSRMSTLLVAAMT